MADPREIIDTIRAFLASAERTRTAELSESASAYAGLCRETNVRLRRCVDYLRRGLRTEAIQLAECQPPLLDLVTSLDLPEAAEWEQVCAAYGLTRSPRLTIEAARELNEAYSDEQGLRELLSRHRLLALSRAALPERLGVLRELATRDPRTACWDHDLRSLEQVRLRELAADALGAVRGGEPESIDRLLEEVNDSRWRSPVPDELKAALSNASRSAHHDRARAALWALVPQAQQAVAAASAAEGQRVLAAWCAVVAKSGIVVPPDLRDVIRPLNQLVDAEEERRDQEGLFRAACEELRTAMADGASVPQLRDQYRRISTMGWAVPETVEREYRWRLAAWERAERAESRRSRILAAAMLLAIGLAVAGLITVIVISSRR